jgi:lipopolysaccharide export system protein LptA
MLSVARNITELNFIKIAILILCILSSFFSYYAYAGEGKSEKIPLEITSKSMVAEDNNTLITFKDSVVAKKGDITLYSDTLVVHYGKQRKVKKIIARGNVTLNQGDKEIKSENAEYFPDDEKVVFTGNPVFHENNNIVSGSKITYLITSEKSIVEDSRVILK